MTTLPRMCMAAIPPRSASPMRMGKTADIMFAYIEKANHQHPILPKEL